MIGSVVELTKTCEHFLKKQKNVIIENFHLHAVL